MPQYRAPASQAWSAAIEGIGDDVAKVLLARSGLYGRGGANPAEIAYKQAQTVNEGLEGQILQMQIDALSNPEDYISKVYGIDPREVGNLLAGQQTNLTPEQITQARGAYGTVGLLPYNLGPAIDDVITSLGKSGTQAQLNAGGGLRAIAQRAAALEGKPQFALESGIGYDPYGAVDQKMQITPIAEALAAQRQASANKAQAGADQTVALTDPKVATEEAKARKLAQDAALGLARTETETALRDPRVAAMEAQAFSREAAGGLSATRAADIEAQQPGKIALTEEKAQTEDTRQKLLEAQAILQQKKAAAGGFKVSEQDVKAALRREALLRGYSWGADPVTKLAIPPETAFIQNSSREEIAAVLEAYRAGTAETGSAAGGAASVTEAFENLPPPPTPVAPADTRTRAEKLLPNVLGGKPAPVAPPPSKIKQVKPKATSNKSAPPTKPGAVDAAKQRTAAKTGIKEAMATLVADPSAENVAAFDALFGAGKAAMVLKAKGISQ